MAKNNKILACISAAIIFIIVAINAYAANNATISIVSQNSINGNVILSVQANTNERIKVYKSVNEKTSSVYSYLSNGNAVQIILSFNDLDCSNTTPVFIYAENSIGERSDVLTIYAHGPHNESEWKTTKAALCTSDGTMEKVCLKCGKLLDSRTVSATGHSWREPVWDWANDGSTCQVTFSCNQDSRHTEKYSVQDIIISQMTNATCSAVGSKTFTASYNFNGRTYTSTKTVPIPKLNHTPGNWSISKSPTCTEKGTKVKKCTKCQAVIESQEVPALGHDYQISYKWDSDNTKCIALAVCSRNQLHTQTETAQGIDTIVSNATCQTPGKFIRTATFVNSLFKSQTKNATITGSHVDSNKDGKCDVCSFDINNSAVQQETTTKAPNIFDNNSSSELPAEMSTSVHFEDSEPTTQKIQNETNNDKPKHSKTAVIGTIGVFVVLFSSTAIVLLLKNLRDDKKKGFVNYDKKDSSRHKK